MKERMSRDEVKSHICSYLLDDFTRLEAEYIRDGEDVLWVANHGSDTGFGYILLTSEQVLFVHFRHISGFLKSRPKQYYVRRGVVDWALNFKGPWIYGPPSYPLSREEINTRHVTSIRYDQIADIARRDYEVNPTTTYVFLTIRLKQGQYLGARKWNALSEDSERPIAFYSLTDGKTAYDLLREQSRQHSHLPDIQDIAGQLEKLADLHRYQAITDDEYERAKRRLIE